MKAIVFFDGGCAPKNPGHAAFAVVVKLGKKRHVLSRYIGVHIRGPYKPDSYRS